jgi:hypothetical protein
MWEVVAVIIIIDCWFITKDGDITRDIVSVKPQKMNDKLTEDGDKKDFGESKSNKVWLDR